jgi:redox-sensing transcriptional repressor
LHAEEPIPYVVIKRLPLYARALLQLVASGSGLISSSDLAATSGVTAAQIRRDLSYFGEFGKSGKGYEAERLLAEITRILNLDRQWRVALVGAGPLGQAVARYRRFDEHGFHIAWIFDHNRDRIGTRLQGLVVEDVATMPERLQREAVEVAIIAVPAYGAQEVADTLVASGVKAILNYAPTALRLPEDVRAYDIDPVAALQSLTYYLQPRSLRARR